jgi:SAM-dependent methyltransferase
MRLEAVAKAGWYPSPPAVVERLTRCLAGPPPGRGRTVRLLDPCCGTGDAAARLAAALGAASYGIELNEERALLAHRCLDHVLTASAFATRLGSGGFSFLFCNPPYDADSQQRRLEHHFLVALSRTLCPGGVLVYLVPQGRLGLSARYLATQYEDLQVYRFPDQEYAAFQQVALFGRRKAKAVLDPASERLLGQLARSGAAGLEPLPEGLDPPYPVPLAPAGEVRFASLHFDAQQAEVEARRRGVLSQAALAEQLWPRDEAPVRPLLPLRQGHLALLIAAGLLNNIALLQGEDRVLVKGRSSKELVEVESDDPSVQVQREVVRTTITVLDLRSGALTRVGQGGAASPRED